MLVIAPIRFFYIRSTFNTAIMGIGLGSIIHIGYKVALVKLESYEQALNRRIEYTKVASPTCSNMSTNVPKAFVSRNRSCNPVAGHAP